MHKAVHIIVIIAIFLVGYLLGNIEHKIVPTAEEVQEEEIITQSPTPSPDTTITPPTIPDSILESVSTKKLEQVYSLLQKNYVSPEEITAEKLEEWMIRGVLYSVEDPYTDYFNEEQSDEFKKEMQGDFEGIGAVLEKRNKTLYITEVLNRRPAATSGLLPGDIIVSVDEQPVADETIWDSVLRIRGEKGTVVTLEIVRNGEPKTFEVTRANIHVENVVLSYAGENNDIAVIEVSQFGDDLEEEFTKVFTEIQTKKLSGIIMDLRYNGGGYMDGAVFLSSHFLPDNTKVLMVETNNGIEEELFTSHTSPDTTTPMVVLVNGGTASSSEIVTAALHENDRIQVVGEETFGKGVVQQIFPLKLGSDEFVKITIAKWLTPSGRNVTHEEALTPDIIVEWDRSEMTDEQFENAYDPQMEKAIEVLDL